jgi:multidrug efflux pump subunit AcrA (membrane-fusion protein)
MPTEHINHEDPITRHTSEMRDIITAVPSRLLRWGTTAFFFVLVMITGLAAFIHYPDVIKTSMVIRSTNQNGHVASNAPGKLIKLFATPGQQVKVGQLLAQIMTPDSKTYDISAPITGKLAYSGILHEEETLVPQQDLFNIEPANESFFGEMTVPQSELGKVSQGQPVLIKLVSYPFEQSGILKGKIKYVSGITNKDNAYLAEVTVDPANEAATKGIKLKDGMQASAEIMIQDASVLQRISRNTFKNIGGK